MIAVGHVIIGGWLSNTTTVYWQVAVRPFTSVTVQVTVVLPDANAVGASSLVPCMSQLSLVVGVPSATPEAVQRPKSVLTIIGAGQLMVGFSVSVTVMVKVQVAVCPFAAVTVNLFVVIPTGNASPLANPLVWAVLAFEQLSVPTGAVNTTTALH